jgi:membrane protease YdiL (CAAX protease family)
MRALLLIYLLIATAEWALVYAVSRRVPIRDLIGRPSNVAVDLAIATAMYGAWIGCARLLEVAFPQGPSRVVQRFLPHGAVEIGAWIALSITAGIAEELLFRGYLQRRVGVIAQGVIFGVLHGYQGLRAALVISVYGLFFGAVAKRYRSIRPGMFAHAWTDIAAGVLRL